MPSKDPGVDAYIAKSADFARPILKHLRSIVHEACPEVNETLKWSAPFFEYKGILGGMAAFKAHCSFILWKGSLVVENKEGGMGTFGRITSLADLPPKKVLVGYVREAMKLNEAGVKTPGRAKPRKPKPEIEVPAYFRSELKKNKKARTTFDGFSPSHRREYIEWITEAKTEPTREKRIRTAIEWMTEGKALRWKYER